MADPVSIGSVIGVSNFSVGLGTFGTIMLWLVIVSSITITFCTILVLWVWNKTYNQVAHVWARINGVPQKIATFKAKWIRVGLAGDRLLFIRGLKKWEYPKLMVGKNEWNFWRRQKDGELINFEFEDLDEKIARMRIKFIDTDVRMQRLGIEKNLEKRLQGKKDWLAIITQIAYVIVFILIFIALVVLFSRLTNVADAMTEMSKAVGQVAEQIARLQDRQGGLSPADNPQSNSGLTPAQT